MGAKPKSTKAQTKSAAPSEPPKKSLKNGKSKAKTVVAAKSQPALNDESATSEYGSDGEEGVRDDDGLSGSRSSAEEDEDEDEESEDDGVDDEGMEKLMKALGDGLDDEGRVQLEVLNGAEGETSGSDEDGSEIEEEDEVEGSGGEVDSEEEKDVALEDVESVDEDAVPRQKIVTNNKVALDRIRSTIMLDASIPWTETLAVTYPESITVDVDDDLNRELAFYKQALHGADTSRSLAASHNFPFTRPSDYFAEMVKSDAHMERIRQRLLDEGAAIKRGEAKRKEREGKKFGKQVQLEKLREREEKKKDMENRLKGLKRKHKGALDEKTGGDDAFDVEVENALADRPSKRSRPNENGRANMSRKGRDAKFGFGGKGRRDKQNTRASTEKFDLGSVGRAPGKGRGGPKGGGKPEKKRPGKSKRMAQRSR